MSTSSLRRRGAAEAVLDLALVTVEVEADMMKERTANNGQKVVKSNNVQSFCKIPRRDVRMGNI